MARNPKHDGTIQIVNKVVGRHLPSGWTLRIQSAVTTDDSEPEPDLAVVRGDEHSYLARHPARPTWGWSLRWPRQLLPATGRIRIVCTPARVLAATGSSTSFTAGRRGLHQAKRAKPPSDVPSAPELHRERQRVAGSGRQRAGSDQGGNPLAVKSFATSLFPRPRQGGSPRRRKAAFASYVSRASRDAGRDLLQQPLCRRGAGQLQGVRMQVAVSAGPAFLTTY